MLSGTHRDGSSGSVRQFYSHRTPFYVVGTYSQAEAIIATIPHKLA